MDRLNAKIAKHQREKRRNRTHLAKKQRTATPRQRLKANKGNVKPSQKATEINHYYFPIRPDVTTRSKQGREARQGKSIQ
jgi:hypothetical protein